MAQEKKMSTKWRTLCLKIRTKLKSSGDSTAGWWSNMFLHCFNHFDSADRAALSSMLNVGQQQSSHFACRGPTVWHSTRVMTGIPTTPD
jgi:hypothetical protein